MVTMKEIRDKIKDKVPLSENKKKIQKATKEECIAALRKIGEDNPEMIVTRNYFRNHSVFAESAWNEHFGTFEEFKRAAGLKLSRHARRMETDVARHASVESYKVMNEEKRNYTGKYLKPKGNRFQTVVIGSDVHDIVCDPFWRKMFIEACKRIKPAKIIINGDLFDLPEFGKFSVDPREWDVVGRIKWVHKFLEDIRKVAPDSELTLVEGNHEYRLLRHLSEATPAMKAVLSDLHGWTVADLLGLTKYEVNYIAPADLATFTKPDQKAEVRRNWMLLYDFIVLHHFTEGKQFGMPGLNGHHHRHNCETLFSPNYGTYEWHQLGAGHRREASYTNGEVWSNGFMIAHVDTLEKRVQFEYVDTTSDHAVMGGQWYSRDS